MAMATMKVEEGQSSHPIPYPKSVFFIVTSEFCERFTFYGLRTILVLYLSQYLLYSQDDATVIYHVFIAMCYVCPVVGAILADSYLGKFRTILYLSVVYAVGSIVISITAIESLHFPQVELTMVGLALIALGTGGIKPCVSAFGGDQFITPQQDLQLQRFFSVFYFSINAGSLLSTFITPVLREDVQCLGQQSCYPLAFGVPAILMTVSIVAFVLGSRWYVMKAPEGNVVVQVAKCIWHALMTANTSSEKPKHWLDKASNRFDKKFIEDVKGALKVMVVLLPVPIFWALFDQQGSRWTFQATRMSGELGNGFYLKPDQMQIANPIIIVLFIPVFEAVVYPAFAKCNLLKRPLQKMVVGGTLAALAFIISAILEFRMQSTYPILPVNGEGQLRLYNAAGCDLEVTLDTFDPFILKNVANWENRTISMLHNSSTRNLDVKWKCQGASAQKSYKLQIFNKQATSYTFTLGDVPYQSTNENVDKSEKGEPMLMLIYSSASQPDFGPTNISVINPDGYIEYQTLLNSTVPAEPFKTLPRGSGYNVLVNGAKADTTFDFDQGGSYVIVAVAKGSSLTTKIHQVTAPNSIHILWQLPQYVTLTVGEIMYSIPGLEFTFTQAPVSMKSLMASAWLLTVAFGNFVVIIVAEAKVFDKASYEFLLFAGLMFLDVLIFMAIAVRYKYVDHKSEDSTQVEGNGNIPLDAKTQQD